MSRTIVRARAVLSLALLVLAYGCRAPHSNAGGEQEVARAGRLYDDGDYAGAAAAYEQAARLDPESLPARIGLGSALPSTPGYVGIYQFVAVSVLTPFGFSRADAIAYILVAQALSYAVIGVWGSLGIVRYRRARRSA